MKRPPESPGNQPTSIHQRPQVKDAAFLRSALANVDSRRERESVEVGRLIQAGGTPVSNELLGRLARMHVGYADAALRMHPAHDISEAIQSYSTTVAVLATATNDLIDQIDSFEARIRSGELSPSSDKAEIEAVERAVQKELFAAAAAAHAVVDHARHIQRLAALENYDDVRRETFGGDGVHDLVIGLRTILHHVIALRAGWSVVTTLGTGSKSADFRLNRDMLKRVFGETNALTAGQLARIDSYLNAKGGDLDVRQLFADYLGRVQTFEAWLTASAMAKFDVELADLRRCRLELHRAASRTWWNLLIGNWVSNFPVPPNPYNHLWKYLKPGELEEVELLEMGSAKQIDRIIELVDKSGACDHALRGLIHAYFQKASGIHGLPLTFPRSAPPKSS